MSFDAAIAHAGGSAQGLAELRSFGIKDLDQFANANNYWRDPARFSPHNLYTSSELLDSLQVLKGYDESKFTPFIYKDGEIAQTITADSVAVEISSALYNLDYSYRPSSNKYFRSVGGAPHIDDNNDQQIALDNVIVMEVPYSVDQSGYYHYDLVGEGKAHIFSNGQYKTARWSRASRQSSFKFKKAGKNFELNRGHTWITAIKPGNSVTVKAAE